MTHPLYRTWEPKAWDIGRYTMMLSFTLGDLFTFGVSWHPRDVHGHEANLEYEHEVCLYLLGFTLQLIRASGYSMYFKAACKHCRCCPLCPSASFPCAGVLQGGFCDRRPCTCERSDDDDDDDIPF